MLDAYRGMNINAAEYMAAVDDILRTMKALGYDAETRSEVLVTLCGVKDAIIRV